MEQLNQKQQFYFRHEKIREHQDELIKDVYNTVSEKKILLAHAVTGLGKTDSAISASLAHALDNNLTIFFLTPKISQHKIAVDVIRGISKKFDLKIRAMDMIGRRYACIDTSLADLDHEGFYQSCEKKRKNEECLFYGNARGYDKLGEAKANTLFNKTLNEYGNVKTHEELIEIGERQFACPYEWMIKIAATSNIIIADYFHIMVPRIRDVFLKKINKRIEDSIVIIDEAHNLAKRIRDHLSSTLNSFMLKRAEREMKLLGLENVKFDTAFTRWASAMLENKRERLVSKNDFDEFMLRYGVEKDPVTSGHELSMKNHQDELVVYLENIGMEFIEKTNKKSACLKIAKFLQNWMIDEIGTIRLLRKRGEYFSISKKFLDPSPATAVLNNTYSSILMSGTLLPLEMHRDVLGLDQNRTIMRRYNSPFDRNNTVNVIAEGTTTRYSKRNFDNYSMIATGIDLVIQNSPNGVAIFFPSYIVLNAVIQLMKTKNLLTQRERMNPREVGDLLRRFSRDEGVLCAVQGGSLAEGIDYANNDIKTAVIVGIALEEMNLEVQALIDHYQNKFGKGWEYGYTYPAIIKALQAAGRSIRKESDKAAIVFMDERFTWRNYKTVLDDGRRFIITNEPEKYVKEFWQ
ncbi:ATP-dependent DNA helicase [Candidatus Micrarchaeota archaeon]|nr:ATP-dependent DNA helicase [Candidatus Micrarchaeota archaeon]